MGVSVCFYKWKPERINIKAHFANDRKFSIYRHSGTFGTVMCWIYTVPCSNWHVPVLFCLLCELATVPWFWDTIPCFLFGMCWIHFVLCVSWPRCRVKVYTVPCSSSDFVFFLVFEHGVVSSWAQYRVLLFCWCFLQFFFSFSLVSSFEVWFHLKSRFKQ